MAVTANARVLVPRPGALLRRYGLFDVANGPLPLPLHASMGGLEWQSAVCDYATVTEIECPSPETPKTFTEGVSTLVADPFVVRSSLACAPVGLTDALLRQRLLERLTATEQSAVERTFSTGDFGQAPSLSNNTPAATDAGASANVTQAIARLEHWLYVTMGYGPTGVLHIPITAAALLDAAGTVHWDTATRTYRTTVGTKVSFGAYTGEGPAGEDPAAGTAYLYITGDVTVWQAPLSDVFVTPLSEAFNRLTNQVTAQAEREYAVGFECYAAYSLTTLWTP